MQPSGLDIGLSGSNIKSIQSGTSTLSATSLNVPISSVDLSKSIVMINCSSTSNFADQTMVSAQITTNTNLQLSKANATTAVVVNWVIIEFNNVKSKQTGSIASNGGTASATITSINMNKALLFCTATNSITSSTSINQALYRYKINTVTSLNFDSSSTTQTIYWQLIEFN